MRGIGSCGARVMHGTCRLSGRNDRRTCHANRIHIDRPRTARRRLLRRRPRTVEDPRRGSPGAGRRRAQRCIDARRSRNRQPATWRRLDGAATHPRRGARRASKPHSAAATCSRPANRIQKLNELYPSRYPRQQALAGKTRAQVLAELVDAQRNGELLAAGEVGLTQRALHLDLFPRAASANGRQGSGRRADGCARSRDALNAPADVRERGVASSLLGDQASQRAQVLAHERVVVQMRVRGMHAVDARRPGPGSGPRPGRGTTCPRASPCRRSTSWQPAMQPRNWCATSNSARCSR